MLAVGVLAFVGIRALGANLHVRAVPDAPVIVASSTSAPANGLLGVLLAMVIVIAASRALGALFKGMHQPPVIGEVLAGILLGPTFFGRAAPALSAVVLPSSLGRELGVIAGLGVLFYMFIVGIDLDVGGLRGKLRSTLTIAQSSIMLPFLFGAAVALWLYPRLAPPQVSFGVFAMFMGLALSVTAFPVLARILSDGGMLRTRLGQTAIGCAAVSDVLAWCLLAFTVGVARERLDGAVRTLLLALAYIAVVVGVVRPLIKRVSAQQDARGNVSSGVIGIAFVGVLLSAFVTELIGIHALFGAFLLGAMVPHDSLLARELTRRLEDIVKMLLLPAFFALVGLKTQMGLVRGTEDFATCALIVLLACAGKLAGTALAARATGLGVRDALSLGVLMNTRGLMELIVLDVGLELGVISPKLFAMLVVMALATTLLTAPLLQALTRRNSLSEEEELSVAGG